MTDTIWTPENLPKPQPIQKAEEKPLSSKKIVNDKMEPDQKISNPNPPNPVKKQY